MMAISDALTLEDMDAILKRGSLSGNVRREEAAEENKKLRLAKSTLTSMSDSLTGLQNAFNTIFAYTKNITGIREEQTKRMSVASKETPAPGINPTEALAKNNMPVSADMSSFADRMPSLLERLDDLGDKLEQLDLSAATAPEQPTGPMAQVGEMASDVVEAVTPGRGLLSTIGKGALIAGGAVAAGYVANEAVESMMEPSPPVDGPAPEPTINIQEVKPDTEAAEKIARENQKTVVAVKNMNMKASVQAAKAGAAAPTSMAVKAGAPSMADKFATFLGSTFNKVTEYVSSLPSKLASLGSGALTAISDAGSAFVEGVTGDSDIPSPSGGDRWIMDMVKKHEGVRNKPYKDSRGLWTVGVGHLIGNGKTLPPEWNRTFSDAEVDQLFAKDFAHHKAAAMKIPGYDKANDLGKGAIIDLTFNMGPAWYKKFKATSAAMAQGNWAQAAAGLQNSLWYKQVGNRAKTIVSMIAKAGGSSTLTGMASAAGRAVGSAGAAVGGAVKTAGAAAGKFVDNVKDIAGNFADFFTLQPSVDMSGVKAPVVKRLKAMGAEYKQRTGKKLIITSAYRSSEKQAKLYALYLAGKGNLAAKPGRSLHEKGLAIDINPPQVDQLISMGILGKFGFHRPMSRKDERQHIEPIEGAKLASTPDNPYNPGSPIATAGKGTKPVALGGKNSGAPIPKSKPVSPLANQVAVQQKVKNGRPQVTVVAGSQVPQGKPGSRMTVSPNSKGPAKTNPSPIKQYLSYLGVR